MLQFVLSASVVLIAAECSVVITTTGPVRGKLVQDEHVSYYAYLGIPYAEPPKGDLRFKVCNSFCVQISSRAQNITINIQTNHYVLT